MKKEQKKPSWMRSLILGSLLALLLVHMMPRRTEYWLRQRVVKLQSAHGSCSGEQIKAPSGKDYILTAGHCRILEEEGSIEVVKEDGTILKRKVVAEDKNSDLLLLEGLPDISGIEIAESQYDGQHILTLTHGKGLKTYRTDGNIVQSSSIQILISLIQEPKDEEKCKDPKYRVESLETLFGSFKFCTMKVDEKVITAKIVPGSSGGAVIDDQGRLSGVASATDDSFGYMVSLKDIQNFTKGY